VKIDGAVALVVGADRSTGYAFGLGLARAGMRVVIGATDGAEEIVEEVLAGGGTAGMVDLDPEDLTSTEAAARSVIDRHGQLDVLLNASPANPTVTAARWDEIDPSDWDRCFWSTVRSAWHLSRAVAPHMKQRRSGAIVFLGSAAAWSGTTGSLHYVTATSALIGLTRSLARELGDFGISVNMVCPDVLPLAGADGDGLARVPWVEPALGGVDSGDVVGPVIFLLGDGAAFITGQSYLINGGAWVQ
jgi:NAD(P)-dependent dehydrogenase (short-subunit alcohol dehydrogenase family)